MALIVCPECKKNISDKAETCPHCGCPISGKKDDMRAGKAFMTGDFYFSRLWRGEYPLRYTFWGSFFAVYMSINILIAMFPEILRRLILPPTATSIGLILAGYLIYAAYLLTCVVGVWRSAANYSGAKSLACAARFCVCCYFVSSLYMTTNGFFLPLLRLFRQLN